jgi:hypothetical protein
LDQATSQTIQSTGVNSNVTFVGREDYRKARTHPAEARVQAYHAFFTIFGAAVALMLVLAIVASLLRLKRRRTLRDFAARHGWSFDHRRDPSLKDRFPEFKRLRSGRRRRYAYNRITGTAGGRPFLAFDYHYELDSTTKDGKSTEHRRFSAVMVASSFPLEPLAIGPGDAFDRLREILGAQRIEFESIEFNRRFFVTSPNRRWAYDVIHPRTMEFLLASPPISIEFGRGTVFACDGSMFSLREFEHAISMGNGLLDRLPSYVVQQQSARK